MEKKLEIVPYVKKKDFNQRRTQTLQYRSTKNSWMRKWWARVDQNEENFIDSRFLFHDAIDAADKRINFRFHGAWCRVNRLCPRTTIISEVIPLNLLNSFLFTSWLHNRLVQFQSKFRNFRVGLKTKRPGLLLEIIRLTVAKNTVKNLPPLPRPSVRNTGLDRERLPWMLVETAPVGNKSRKRR